MFTFAPFISGAVQIPEYCRVLEESEISEHCFDLIFAFDEIVALGYRENVNLAQIRTFTEMDSHEEKVFRAVREVRSPKMEFKYLLKAWKCKAIRTSFFKLESTSQTSHQ